MEQKPLSFGKTLQRIRRPRGTQKEIASKIPMDLGYFSRLENDRYSYPPSRETIEKIADALECSPEERNELLAAAGRIDVEVEQYARLATQKPVMRRLFKAVSRLDAEQLEELLKEVDPPNQIENSKGIEILNINAPAPSRYVPHQVIEDVATQCNFIYREQTGNKHGYPVDTKKLTEVLRIPLVWDYIEEPEDAIFFACYSQNENEGEILLNQKHNNFFETRPDVFCATLAHEIGHCILNHNSFNDSSSDQLLFADMCAFIPVLHKSSWFPYGLSGVEVERLKVLERKVKEKLVKKALLDTKSRAAIEHLRDKYEPEWMFRQAEHFSRCLLIPKDRILEILEEPWDFNSWSSIYRIADTFGVPKSMVRIRLEKMGIIEIGEDGRPHLTLASKQQGLFKSSR
jgi:transcriptional regulator with XRE-family HTH domain/Zn-dependent peptidase ImmA (M78 family)